MSLVTLIFFTLFHIFEAVPPLRAETKPGFPQPRFALEDITKIRLPRELGTVRERYQGNSNRLVLYVEDAHAQYEAQKSIQKIIDYFQKRHGLERILLEGGTGRLDPFLFRQYPYFGDLQKVFEGYLRQGELSGAVSAAVLNENDADYYGIEDQDLYEAGILAFQDAQKFKNGTLREIERVQGLLDRRKRNYYPNIYRALGKALKSFESENSSLSGLLRIMKKTKALSASPDKYPHLWKLAQEARGDSAFDRAGLKKEINKFLERAKDLASGDTDMRLLNQRIQEYRTAQIGSREFAVFLLEWGRRNRLDVSRYGILRSAGKDFELVNGIEPQILFTELDAYVSSLKSMLLKNPRARAVDRLDEQLGRYRLLANLELPRKDWDALKPRMKKHLSWARARHIDLSYAASFYHNAEKRDRALFENLKANMTKNASREAKTKFEFGTSWFTPFSPPLSPEGRGEKVPKSRTKPAFGGFQLPEIYLLVTGGFHTQSLTQALRKEGVSYVLISPRFTQFSERDQYVKAMKGDVSWKKYFQAAEGKVNLYRAFTEATIDRLLELGKERAKTSAQEHKEDRLFDFLGRGNDLKRWRDELIRSLARRGKIKTAGSYTSFLDRAALRRLNADEKMRLKLRAASRMNRFLTRLEKLVEEDSLSEAHLRPLFGQQTAVPVLHVASMIPTYRLPARLLEVSDGIRQKKRQYRRIAAGTQRMTNDVDDDVFASGTSQKSSIRSRQRWPSQIRGFLQSYQVHPHFLMSKPAVSAMTPMLYNEILAGVIKEVKKLLANDAPSMIEKIFSSTRWRKSRLLSVKKTSLDFMIKWSRAGNLSIINEIVNNSRSIKVRVRPGLNLRSEVRKPGMDMSVKIIGGADDQGPGGSSFLIQVGKSAKFLLDAGRGSAAKFKHLGPDEIPQAVFLSHAHMDHAGDVPEATAQFGETPLYATQATGETAFLLWEDALKFQDGRDARLKKQHIQQSVENFRFVEEGIWYEFDAETKILFSPASHIWGANLIYVATPHGNLVYSGDFSNEDIRGARPLRLPAAVPVDYLLMEATYGDRLRTKTRDQRESEFAASIGSFLRSGKRVLIPAFAVGRIPDLALTIRYHQNHGGIPGKVPIFVDGLASLILENYERFFADSGESADQEVYKSVFGDETTITYVTDDIRQKLLSGAIQSPYVILAGSGMLQGGRIYDYLPLIADQPDDLLILAGYQAEQTLGKAIQQGERKIKINGKEILLKAQVQSHDFGAHADQSGLKELAERIQPGRIFLIHGHLNAKAALQRELSNRGLHAVIPKTGEEIALHLTQELRDQRRQFFETLHARPFPKASPTAKEADKFPEAGTRKYELAKKDFIRAALGLLEVRNTPDHRAVLEAYLKSLESQSRNVLTFARDQLQNELNRRIPHNADKKEVRRLKNLYLLELAKTHASALSAKLSPRLSGPKPPHPKTPAVRRQEHIDDFTVSILKAYLPGSPHLEETWISRLPNPALVNQFRDRVFSKEDVEKVVAVFVDQPEFQFERGPLTGLVAQALQNYFSLAKGYYASPEEKWRMAWTGLLNDFGSRAFPENPGRSEMRTPDGPKALLFDLDGVLFQMPSVEERFRQAAAQLEGGEGIEISPWTLRDEIYFLGSRTEIADQLYTGTIDALQYIGEVNERLKPFGLSRPLSLELFMTYLAGDRSPAPGAFEALKRLKEQGKTLGILSNRFQGDRKIWFELIRKYYPGIFDEELIFFSNELGLKKPHREVFGPVLRVFSGKGIRAEEILFMDDVDFNLKAAKSLGFKTVQYWAEDGNLMEDIPELARLLGNPPLPGQGIEKLNSASKRVRHHAAQQWSRLFAEHARNPETFAKIEKIFLSFVNSEHIIPVAYPTLAWLTQVLIEKDQDIVEPAFETALGLIKKDDDYAKTAGYSILAAIMKLEGIDSLVPKVLRLREMLEGGGFDENSLDDVLIGYLLLMNEIRSHALYSEKEIKILDYRFLIAELQKRGLFQALKDGRNSAAGFEFMTEKEEKALDKLLEEIFRIEHVLREIQEKAGSRPVMVIFNHFLGSLPKMVMESLFPKLHMTEARMSSAEVHENEFYLSPKWLKEEDIRYLHKNRPHVVILDGSTSVHSVDFGTRHVADAWLGTLANFYALDPGMTPAIADRRMVRDEAYFSLLEKQDHFPEIRSKSVKITSAIRNKIDSPPYRFLFWIPSLLPPEYRKNVYLRVLRSNWKPVPEILNLNDQANLSGALSEGPAIIFFQYTDEHPLSGFYDGPSVYLNHFIRFDSRGPHLSLGFLDVIKNKYFEKYPNRPLMRNELRQNPPEITLSPDFDTNLDQGARLLLKFRGLLAAFHVLLKHKNIGQVEKIIFHFDAAGDSAFLEKGSLHVVAKNPETLSVLEALELFRRSLGWDFEEPIRTIQFGAPHLLYHAGDFGNIHVILHERMAGMGDLVFVVNTAQLLSQVFPGKKVRLILGQDKDLELLAKTKLLKDVDPALSRQDIQGIEVIRGSEPSSREVIDSGDIAIIYALGATPKDVYQEKAFYERLGGRAKAKIMIYELGFSSRMLHPLEHLDGHLGLGSDQIGMAPVSPFSKVLYARKYPREEPKIRAERMRILKKLPGWQNLEPFFRQKDLSRIVASEWGFIYAHEARTVKDYFGDFERARKQYPSFGGDIKTFFVMTGSRDKEVQSTLREIAEKNRYHLVTYSDQTRDLKLDHQAPDSRVLVVMDYSVPRKLFGELFLYSDDLPTVVTGQDNLANILYLNLLSSGRPFFWEVLPFQFDAQSSFFEYIKEKMGEDASRRLRGLWIGYGKNHGDSARMFALPKEYRKFFKQIAQAVDDARSFLPQLYYLMLRGIARGRQPVRGDQWIEHLKHSPSSGTPVRSEIHGEGAPITSRAGRTVPRPAEMVKKRLLEKSMESLSWAVFFNEVPPRREVHELEELLGRIPWKRLKFLFQTAYGKVLRNSRSLSHYEKYKVKNIPFLPEDVISMIRRHPEKIMDAIGRRLGIDRDMRTPSPASSFAIDGALFPETADGLERVARKILESGGYFLLPFERNDSVGGRRRTLVRRNVSKGFRRAWNAEWNHRFRPLEYHDVLDYHKLLKQIPHQDDRRSLIVVMGSPELKVPEHEKSKVLAFYLEPEIWGAMKMEDFLAIFERMVLVPEKLREHYLRELGITRGNRSGLLNVGAQFLHQLIEIAQMQERVQTAV